MPVVIDGFHGAALRLDIHGRDVFGVQEDDILCPDRLPFFIQDREGVVRTLFENGQGVSTAVTSQVGSGSVFR